ncbi:UNVERIFIED_CONTAM: hypothetical protein Sradi_3734300 [Sesamum radiatum]|uniref:Uncharacterized protein n=1 Tax=Sesamum radiatum TaxID=300843 RepID=A0AAW2PYA7_SESRA
MIRENTGSSSGFSAPTMIIFPCGFNKLNNGSIGCCAETVLIIPSKVPAAAIISAGSRLTTNSSAPRPSRASLFLPWSYVAQPAKPGNADVEARFVEPVVSQRAVSSDPCAEQRSSLIQRQIFRPADSEILIDHHDVGVTTVSDGAVGQNGVVRQNRLGTVILEIVGALIALPAGVHKTSHPNFVTDPEFLDLGTDFSYHSDDLMTGYDRVSGGAPFVLDGVKIGMADAAVQYFELNVAVAGGASGEIERRENSGRVSGSHPNAFTDDPAI